MGVERVHAVAASGFARGAQAYANGRPGYPAATIDWLCRDLGIGPDSRVVEVGAGTGLFTQLLMQTGAAIAAVDPVCEMLDRLAVTCPGVDAIVAPAQSIPLDDGSVDAILSATAFHWFASMETLREFHRLLRPGGMVGLIWNLRDERVPWVARLSEITNRRNRAAPRERDEDWRAPFVAESGFSSLVETVMTYAHHGPVEDVVVGRTLSTSFIAALDDGARAEVVAEVRALIAATPELASGGDVTFPYVTRAYRCRRID